MTKKFKEHFHMLLDKLKNHEHFAFCRFSDGEMHIMYNRELKLAGNHNIINKKRDNKAAYAPEDRKHFIPEQHQFFREKLMESYRFKKKNYFVGLSCRCCVGEANFKQFLDWYEGDPSDVHLTWSNLWANSNYPLFKKQMIPEFKKHKVVLVVNQKATFKKLPFPVVKDFRIGHNCIINNYDLIEEMKTWISENNIEDHVFLFSASSLSNFLAHQLFDFRDSNTYIDIGTCLNPWLGLTTKRGYLKGGKSLKKTCIW